MHNRSIILLSLAFALIFFGFNGVQQYVTIYFDQIGSGTIGFVSLILIYLFFTLCSPAAVPVMKKIGERKTMILAALFYGFYIFSLLVPSVTLVIVSSILLGISAALLWTAQGTYLIRTSSEGEYGKNAGLFTTIWACGAALGIFTFGLVAKAFGFEMTLVVYALFPFIGLFLFLFLSPTQDVPTHEKKATSMLRLCKSRTLVRVSLINILFMFAFGLVIGSLPLLLNNHFSLEVIGYVGGIFFVTSFFFSYLIGSLSDRVGRMLLIMIALLCLLGGLALLAIFDNRYVLLGAIALLAIVYATIRPLMQALVGVISTADNVDKTVALFSVLQNVGVVGALIVSFYFTGKSIYWVSLVCISMIMIFVFPILRWQDHKVRNTITSEIDG